MKLIVMSDSHGDLETIEAIRSRESDADAVFHCGDSELAVDAEILQGMEIVQGNCDWNAGFPESVVAEVDGQKVLMVHGHQHGVKESLMQLKYAAEQVGASIALFGHSHLYGAELQDGVLYVNPGSTLLPRGERVATYAVIEQDDSLKVTFRSPDSGEAVEKVIFTTS
ncbi:metallophosphoesterase [Sporosarcina gallistercoris]|uniref:Phosphoesterase n=1 Tax=Sporosarcina gallistercoris TaxID=2762245 RepID=A0ABR8PIM4_9BACL|nr:metallophosphoesterase [Sporosarcina gallistercoris]MBD7908017.1 metallophosphoesterase [Sporosarcina gallistercoris]